MTHEESVQEIIEEEDQDLGLGLDQSQNQSLNRSQEKLNEGVIKKH